MKKTPEEFAQDMFNGFLKRVDEVQNLPFPFDGERPVNLPEK